jgi:hypothetical protein
MENAQLKSSAPATASRLKGTADRHLQETRKIASSATTTWGLNSGTYPIPIRFHLFFWESNSYSQYVRFSYGFRFARAIASGPDLIVLCAILPQDNGFLLIPLDY